VPTRLFSSAEIIAKCDPALYLDEDAQRVRDEIWTRINGSKTRTATCGISRQSKSRWCGAASSFSRRRGFESGGCRRVQRTDLSMRQMIPILPPIS